MKQKLKLVLLPTSTKSHIYLNNNTKKLGYVTGNYPEDLEQFKQTDIITQNQQLYAIAINDKRPKIGDYVVNLLHSIEGPLKVINNQTTNKEVSLEYVLERPRYCKVIVTTDEFLLVDYKGYEYGTAREYEARVHLPVFSLSFLNTYINEYNKGNIIDTIEVEYEECFPGVPSIFDGLKINSDNTINASLIEDKLYTKEEVIDKLLIYKADLLVEVLRANESKRSLQKEFTDNWLKNNL